MKSVSPKNGSRGPGRGGVFSRVSFDYRFSLPEASQGWLWAVVYEGRGACGPSVSRAFSPGLAHRPTPKGALSSHRKARLLQGFPCRLKMGRSLVKSPRDSGGEEEPAASFCGTEAFPWGTQLRPTALGSAESQSFCQAACDPVRLNCNFGLWPDSLAVCFTNSYLWSQIRLIKKPAPHGAINVTRTSRE